MSEKFFVLLSFFVFIFGLLSLIFISVFSQSSSFFSLNGSVDDSSVNFFPENQLLSMSARVVSQKSSAKGTVFTLVLNDSFKAFFDKSLNDSFKGKVIRINGFYEDGWFTINSIAPR